MSSPQSCQSRLFTAARCGHISTVYLSSCLEERPAESQRELFYIRAVTLKEEEEEGMEMETTAGGGGGGDETCLEGRQVTELPLDPHVSIRYQRGVALIGQPVRVSLSLRSNFSADFVVVR